MIADQQIGKNFMKALDYNLRKMNRADPKSRAELLETNFTSLDLLHIQKEIDLVRQLRPNRSKYVCHTSLNFSSLEDASLNNEILLSIAQDYLSEMGFTNNQYFIFRHHDTENPHIHLLVNRICFDGSVVSDSNNFKRSEALLRKLEYQYNLLPMEQSSYKAIAQNNTIAIRRAGYVSDRPPKKNELEMVVRTGKPSDKMVLQEILKRLLTKKLSLNEFIAQAEQQGIYLLFNQASTGRVSGVTYFYKDFKAKGQALGNRFKWAEVIKYINYEQTRDSQAVSAANSRTLAKYGESRTFTPIISSEGRTGTHELPRGRAENPGLDGRKSEFINKTGGADRSNRTAANESVPDVNHHAIDSPDHHSGRFDGTINIEISDDIDDEAIHGRNRRRERQARTHT